MMMPSPAGSISGDLRLHRQNSDRTLTAKTCRRPRPVPGERRAAPGRRALLKAISRRPELVAGPPDGVADRSASRTSTAMKQAVSARRPACRDGIAAAVGRRGEDGDIGAASREGERGRPSMPEVRR